MQEQQFAPGIKNKALCREELDTIQNGNYHLNGFEEIGSLTFFEVIGISDFWSFEKISPSSLAGSILSSFVNKGIPFAYILSQDEQGLHIYIGTASILQDNLISTYQSVYPGIQIQKVNHNPFNKSAYPYGGHTTGIPTRKSKDGVAVPQIENIIRGMQGKNFSYIVVAKGVSRFSVAAAKDRLIEEMSNTFQQITTSITGGIQGNTSITQQNTQAKVYYENLEALLDQLNSAFGQGMWRVNVYYSAQTAGDARSLGNIIRTTFSGEESKPEPFRTLDFNSIQQVIAHQYMISDLSVRKDIHPLGIWQNANNQMINLYIYQFQTLLASDQLGTLCELPLQEFPGFFVNRYVDFDVANRTIYAVQHPVALGNIVSSMRQSLENSAFNPYTIEKNDFTRHCLIIGITGGGKTNTSKSILSTLWRKEKVPFLVIESAKREYWELRNLEGFEDLVVFTLGSEASKTSVKYRINPFETLPGISLQTHIDYLLSTFKAAFDMVPPMPYVLEQAVYAIYEDRGWDISENTNRYGLTRYPTLEDLHDKISVIVDELGYQDEMQSNVKASLEARIKSLMIGGKGAMLNTPVSIPINRLLQRPVVMELEDLGDDETKSFVIGILMVQLYEYRKSLMDQGSKALSHILMIEEAHRLLKNVSGQEGSQAKSVEFFCNMLAEIRTYGQGIIIADQVPTKLAPDTIKNTNLKIVHRTVAYEDRDAMGKAMNMTEDQTEYLSSLQRGYAAVHAEGDNRPKIIKFPLICSKYSYTRQQVINESRNKVSGLLMGRGEERKLTQACRFCEKQCQYFVKTNPYLMNKVNQKKVVSIWESRGYSPASLHTFLKSNLMKDIYTEDIQGCLCILSQVLDAEPHLGNGDKKKILAGYLEYRNS